MAEFYRQAGNYFAQAGRISAGEAHTKSAQSSSTSVSISIARLYDDSVVKSCVLQVACRTHTNSIKCAVLLSHLL
jgi:hypothetical protein